MYKELLLGVYFLIGIYLVYRLFTAFSRPSQKFQEEINEILTSEEYKVKGKYDEMIK